MYEWHIFITCNNLCSNAVVWLWGSKNWSKTKRCRLTRYSDDKNSINKLYYITENLRRLIFTIVLRSRDEQCWINLLIIRRLYLWCTFFIHGSMFHLLLVKLLLHIATLDTTPCSTSLSWAHIRGYKQIIHKNSRQLIYLIK